MKKLATQSVRRVVDRVLDEPKLAALVGRLEPRAIRSLVEHVGLEDAGDIVALLSTEQLARVFDEDLWRSVRPGDDETFDADRFALWLEVLLLSDEAGAVAKVAALDEDLLALGLSREVLVIDIEAMAVEMAEDRSDDHDQLEKALESCLYEEIEEFRVIARDPARWDAVLAILVGLDRDHHALVRRLLERIAKVSAEHIADNGDLYDVLTSEEMLASDVGGERLDRREEEGFVAASDALSFLRLAVRTPLEDLVRAKEHDAVVRGHEARSRAARRRVVAPPPATDAISRRAEAFVHELAAADHATEPRPSEPRLLGGVADARARPSHLLDDTMGALRDVDPTRFAAFLEEVAFLVNALVAVAGGEARLGAIDATRVALAIGSRGLRHLAEATGLSTSDALADRGPIHAFRVGLKIVSDGDDFSRDALERMSARASEARDTRPSRGPRKPKK